MRARVTNARDNFRVTARAGAGGVLLAMDADVSRRAGLPGFAR